MTLAIPDFFLVRNHLCMLLWIVSLIQHAKIMTHSLVHHMALDSRLAHVQHPEHTQPQDSSGQLGSAAARSL